MAQYTEPNNNDIGKLAIASFIICLAINIILGLYTFSINNNGETTPTALYVYGQVIEKAPISGGITIKDTIERQQLEQLACDRGDPNCEGIKTSAQQSLTTSSDLLQTLGNTPKMFGFILNIISMSILGPLIIASALNSLVNNPFLIIIIAILGTLLQVLIFWSIIKFFFKK